MPGSLHRNPGGDEIGIGLDMERLTVTVLRGMGTYGRTVSQYCGMGDGCPHIFLFVYNHGGQ